jgi:hypothetical protein
MQEIADLKRRVEELEGLVRQIAEARLAEDRLADRR